MGFHTNNCMLCEHKFESNSEKKSHSKQRDNKFAFIESQLHTPFLLRNLGFP